MSPFSSLFGGRTPGDEGAALTRMVEQQIHSRGVSDPRVLDAMRAVPRARFVLPEDLAEAHDDHPLSIGRGQTISQPYIVALMLEALELTGAERVLEIGTGSGYQTALLARLAREVVTVERIESRADAARARLEMLGVTGVTVLVGDGTLGCPDRAPFDAVVVTAASPRVPQPLVEQLAEGGRLVIPIGGRHEQMLVQVRRSGGRTTERDLCPCRFVPLIGAEGFEA